MRKNTNSFIPIHNFAQDDETSVPIEIRPLEKRNHYDALMPHRHNYYEIFLFVKGGGTHLIDFSEYPIGDNSVHFVSPGQVHQVKRELSSYGTLISFSREFFLEELHHKDRLYQIPFLHNYSGSPVFEPEQEAFAELQKLSKDIQREGVTNDPDMRRIIHSYLNIFLLKCRSYFNQKASDLQATDSDQTLAQRFRYLLDKHFQEWHFVKQYAAKLNVTPRKLNEAVSKHQGRTASELVSDRILLESRRLVKYTDHSIKEIAWFLNFEDPAYFNRFYKKHTGKTPGEERENS